MKTARQTALDLLIRMEKEDSYSNLLLDSILSQSGLEQRDKAFVTTLYYGVLERKITLDAVVCQYSRLPLSKLSADILSVLRLGIYQLLYMDHVPESASVNESVSLAEYCRKKSAKGFINAVLRNFIRDGKKVPVPGNPVSALSVLYSCPEWLVKQWIEDYGAEQAEQILKCSLESPPIAIRVNTLKITPESLLKELNKEHVAAKLHPTVQNCLLLQKSGDIERLSAYQKGYFHVQDIASQICCLALDPQKGERIMDVCAAPGGKSFTAAIQMENQGIVQSFDLYPKRTKLIQTGAERLGLSAIEPKVANAKEFREEYCGADRVLCDVPCSGLGVIRRKPEIKYKAPEKLRHLPDIQLEILQNVSQYVRPGGILLYSTCSLCKGENERVVERFLSKNAHFSLQKLPEACKSFSGKDEANAMLTLFPDKHGTDGFFIARLKRSNSK